MRLSYVTVITFKQINTTSTPTAATTENDKLQATEISTVKPPRR